MYLTTYMYMYLRLSNSIHLFLLSFINLYFQLSTHQPIHLHVYIHLPKSIHSIPPITKNNTVYSNCDHLITTVDRKTSCNDWVTIFLAHLSDTIQCVPQKRKPINRVNFSENCNDLSEKAYRVYKIQFILFLLTPVTRCSRPCMNKHWPFQMVMSKMHLLQNGMS